MSKAQWFSSPYLAISQLSPGQRAMPQGHVRTLSHRGSGPKRPLYSPLFPHPLSLSLCSFLLPQIVECNGPYPFSLCSSTLLSVQHQIWECYKDPYNKAGDAHLRALTRHGFEICRIQDLAFPSVWIPG